MEIRREVCARRPSQERVASVVVSPLGRGVSRIVERGRGKGKEREGEGRELTRPRRCTSVDAVLVLLALF